MSIYRLFLKRAFDFLIAAVMLVLLAPIMAVVAIAVLVSMGRPVLFRQTRIGRGERPFTIFKFRTMREAYRPDGTPLLDHERLTRVGSLLRKASLDELPQLWNVLIGQMSLVGPRPLLVEYLPYYTDREKLRHTVRPGITGWSQVNGRNQAAWDDRLEADAYYVEHLSFGLDVKILFLTVAKVFGGSDTEFAEKNSDLQKLSVERSGGAAT